MRATARPWLAPTAISALLLQAALGSPELAKASEVAIAGAGGITCAHYADLMRADPKTADSLFSTWAQGYMSGVNMEFIRSHHPTTNLGDDRYTAAEQLVFLHTYCDQHPLAAFVSAVMALYLDISRRVPLMPPPRDR